MYPPPHRTIGGKGVNVATKAKTAKHHIGVSTPKRHRKILRETIQGISAFSPLSLPHPHTPAILIHPSAKPDIRRLARRGGVKRISAGIYEELRAVLKRHLTDILRDCVTVMEGSGSGSVVRKTVTVSDVSHLDY